MSIEEHRAVEGGRTAATRDMTEEQEKHLQRVKDDFVKLVDPKYRKGQKEHGGDLFTKPSVDLLDSAIEEAVDQFVYLSSLREHLYGIRNR
jgi:hypothetical protein